MFASHWEKGDCAVVDVVAREMCLGPEECPCCRSDLIA
jgi:hypothetical protein